MGASFLTVDLGNSAIKFRAWRVDSNAALACIDRMDLANDLANEVDLVQFFERNSALELAAMSSVAGVDATACWREIIRRRTHAQNAIFGGR